MENTDKPTLTEEYGEVTEYIAKLEGVLLFFAERWESPLSDAHLDILAQVKKEIAQGQQMRRAFERRLRSETP